MCLHRWYWLGEDREFTLFELMRTSEVPVEPGKTVRVCVKCGQHEGRGSLSPGEWRPMWNIREQGHLDEVRWWLLVLTPEQRRAYCKRTGTGGPGICFDYMDNFYKEWIEDHGPIKWVEYLRPTKLMRSKCGMWSSFAPFTRKVGRWILTLVRIFLVVYFLVAAMYFLCKVSEALVW